MRTGGLRTSAFTLMNKIFMMGLCLLLVPFVSAEVNIFYPLSSGSSGGGNSTSYFTNTSSDTIELLPAYDFINFDADDGLTASDGEGEFRADTTNGFEWVRDDGSVTGNNPYFSIDTYDIHPSVDFFIPILKATTNFGSFLGGVYNSLYVLGASSSTFGSILITTSGFQVGGADPRTITLTGSNSNNETLLQSNFGDIVLDPNSGDEVRVTEDLTVEGDLHAGVYTSLVYGVTNERSGAIPFGACGHYWWDYAYMRNPYYLFTGKANWDGFNSVTERGQTIPCNGTITRVAGSHYNYDYNNSGNLDEAYINISMRINNVDTYFGQYVEDSVGMKNFVLENSIAVTEGDNLGILYNMSVIGAGADDDNDFCIDELNTVVILLCEQ